MSENTEMIEDFSTDFELRLVCLSDSILCWFYGEATAPVCVGRDVTSVVVCSQYCQLATFLITRNTQM